MPGLDGTGPAGMGPMTGGARGACNPYSSLYSGYTRRCYPYRAFGAYPWSLGLGRPRWGTGRGLGRGYRGRGGRGRGRW
jgi:hypothetical protein